MEWKLKIHQKWKQDRIRGLNLRYNRMMKAQGILEKGLFDT